MDLRKTIMTTIMLCMWGSSVFGLPIYDGSAQSTDLRDQMPDAQASSAVTEFLRNVSLNDGTDARTQDGARNKRDTAEDSDDIFVPCGGKISAGTTIPDDELPIISLIIKDLTAGVGAMKDRIATLRIADSSVERWLGRYHASRLGYSLVNYDIAAMDEALSKPKETLKSLLLNQLRYTKYVQNVITTEKEFSFRESILPDLEILEAILMRSFSCGIAQFAINVDVTIDGEMMADVSSITYTQPASKMYATYEAYILFNSLESNFLGFAQEFFEKYVGQSN